MIDPKEITLKTQDGKDKIYILSKIPAIPAREIITQYPISAMPKVGDYKVNEQIMLKLMSYVAIPVEGAQPQRLITQALINNHCPDWEILARLEAAMIEYNCSFFQNGKVLNFLAGFNRKLPQLITGILTDLQAQSSQKEKQPSTN